MGGDARMKIESILLWSIPVVGGLLILRQAAKANSGAITPTGPVAVPETAWDRDERVRVPLNTTVRTVGWTMFPNPALAIIAGQLSDEGASMRAKLVKSEMYTGSHPNGNAHNDIELFTGSVAGPVEVLLQSSPSGSDRTTLKLQLG